MSSTFLTNSISLVFSIWSRISCLKQNRNKYEKNIETNPIYNPVSMYFGKGLCWHFPCSLSCNKTKQMIDKRISLLKKHEKDLLNRLLEIKDYKIIYKNQKYDLASTNWKLHTKVRDIIIQNFSLVLKFIIDLHLNI